MNKLYLPAIKGHFGDWVYYSCQMPLGEVARRVDFASDLNRLHTGEEAPRLSELLQRSLKPGREREIAKYLRLTNQRMFNSLVLAVFGGDPRWHEIDAISAKSSGIRIEDIPEGVLDSVGFLSFTDSVRMFAIDGQHRLAGIKEAITKAPDLEEDEASVILVAHKNTPAGRQRTRRLFTTLNKTAKSVATGDIIALDEDDVMALCVRKLVYEHPHFVGKRILYNATTNIPPTNRECLTTIGNLYHVLKILFTHVDTPLRKKPKDLQFFRPSDEVLESYYNLACEYFDLLKKHNLPLKQFFTARQFGRVVKKYRGDFGGNVLFRPLGLTVLVEVVAHLSQQYTLEQSVEFASWNPQDLSEPPHAGVLFNVSKGTMIPSGRVLARNLLLYMLSEDVDEEEVSMRYGAALGQPSNGKTLLKSLPIIAE